MNTPVHKAHPILESHPIPLTLLDPKAIPSLGLIMYPGIILPGSSSITEARIFPAGHLILELTHSLKDNPMTSRDSSHPCGSPRQAVTEIHPILGTLLVLEGISSLELIMYPGIILPGSSSITEARIFHAAHLILRLILSPNPITSLGCSHPGG